MERQKYEKPKVVSPGYSPEPVEAGCCLTSCGGAPSGMQAGRHLNREAESTLAMLEQASSKLMNR